MCMWMERCNEMPLGRPSWSHKQPGEAHSRQYSVIHTYFVSYKSIDIKYYTTHGHQCQLCWVLLINNHVTRGSASLSRDLTDAVNVHLHALSWKLYLCDIFVAVHFYDETTLHNAHPASKVHGDSMGHIWGRKHLGGPHAGPMNLAIWAYISKLKFWLRDIVTPSVIFRSLM